MKRFFSLLLGWAALAADGTGTVSEAELREAVASSGNPVAGFYRATDSGATLAVVPAGQEEGKLRIVVVEAEVPAVRPGTDMGWMRPTGSADTYAGELFTKAEGDRLENPKKFTFKAVDGSRLEILPKRPRVKLRLWKLLPYMFRAPISIESQSAESAAEGLLRVWPQSPSSPPPIPRAL